MVDLALIYRDLYQENVAKTRLEYERCLEQFSLARAKHEEQKSKGSKRSDEYRDRYIKVREFVNFTSFILRHSANDSVSSIDEYRGRQPPGTVT